MKKITNLVFLSLLFTSCVSIQGYIPNALNAPLLQKRGDFKASILTGGTSGGDISTAYAVTGHSALMSNFFYNPITSLGMESYSTYWQKNKSLYGELAYGYYEPCKADNYCFEVYLGLGIGRLNRVFQDRTIPVQDLLSDGTIQKLFIQFNYGNITGLKENTFILRFSGIHSPDLYLSGYGEYNEGYPATIKYYNSYIEGAYMYSYGRRLKFQMEAGYSMALKHIDFLATSSVILRAGLKFEISRK